MKLAIDIPAETYKAISEWDEPNPKYAAEYMLYQFVKNGKRIEQTNCSDAISRSEAIRIASGYCHWSNIPTELAKLPPVNQKPCGMTAEEYRKRMIQAFHNADCDELISVCVLPTEKEFENLEWLLKNHYKKEPREDAISRKQALDAFGLSEKTRKYGGDHSGYNTMMLYEIQEVIEGLPSVSTEKTGRWIVNRKYMECSNCHDVWFFEYNQTDQFKYCPNCGARMEVEE